MSTVHLSSVFEWLVKNEWMKGKDIYRDIIQTIKKGKRGKRGNCDKLSKRGKEERQEIVVLTDNLRQQ